MNKWSRQSRKKLEQCHVDLQIIFNTVLQIHDCSVTTGYRNEYDQNKAYVEGKSKLKWPYGKHNNWPSDAIDVKPYLSDFHIDGSNPDHMKYFYKFAGIVYAVAYWLKKLHIINHTVRWGGDWDSDLNMDDQTFNDLYHWELVK